MSEEDSITVDTSNAQVLTAEYRDGQLKIVEVTPFDKTCKEPTSILPDMSDHGDKYNMQVLDADKGLVQLDLLNLTLVRCSDDEESYQLVASGDTEGGDTDGDTTVTCVLQSSDGDDEQESQEYVMMDGEPGSLVFLQQPSQNETRPQKKAAPTPAEILERAKALQKAKAFMNQSASPRLGKRGRKRRSDLPSPHELLASPNFKLYLYSCKLCNFKCNAVKELTAHKRSEHLGGGGGAGRAREGRGPPPLQCARCPYRGATQHQLIKHVQEKHRNEKETYKISLDSKEVEEADVLVCGACGFESSSRFTFRRHIETEHGASTS